MIAAFLSVFYVNLDFFPFLQPCPVMYIIRGLGNIIPRFVDVDKTGEIIFCETQHKNKLDECVEGVCSLWEAERGLKMREKRLQVFLHAEEQAKEGKLI